MTSPTVVLIDLDRRGALGAKRRRASWAELFSMGGASIEVIGLLSQHRRRRPPSLAELRAVAQGATMPETISWDLDDARDRLLFLEPRAVVCLTGRAFHPAFADGPWATVLDMVDQLSDSYDQRAQVRRGLRRHVLRTLSWSSRRFEASARPPTVRTVFAGWSDARRHGVDWIPNFALAASNRRPEILPSATSDLIFVGSLDYPPNIDALQFLGAQWAALQRRRPGITMLVAGARPGPAVRELADRWGWTLVADFGEAAAIHAQARLSVAPLRFVGGMQNKVLDAATFGVPQVLSPEAASGFRPGFPARVAPLGDAFIDAIIELLDNAGACEALASQAQDEVSTWYRPPIWLPWAAAVLDGRQPGTGPWNTD